MWVELAPGSFVNLNRLTAVEQDHHRGHRVKTGTWPTIVVEQDHPQERRLPVNQQEKRTSRSRCPLFSGLPSPPRL
jgi:hypothetical protein